MPERLAPTSRVQPYNQLVLLAALVTRVETVSSETAPPTIAAVAVAEPDRREVPLGMFRVDGLVSGVWDFGFRSFQH